MTKVSNPSMTKQDVDSPVEGQPELHEKAGARNTQPKLKTKGMSTDPNDWGLHDGPFPTD